MILQKSTIKLLSFYRNSIIKLCFYYTSKCSLCQEKYFDKIRQLIIKLKFQKTLPSKTYLSTLYKKNYFIEQLGRYKIIVLKVVKLNFRGIFNKEITFGKYGRMRLDYLEQYKKIIKKLPFNSAVQYVERKKYFF